MATPANNVAVFPAAGAPTTITVNGRVYTNLIGSAPIVVPDFDAFVLLSNGWIQSAANGAGTTAQRPVGNHALGISPPVVGFRYFDSTIGANIIWNGKNWINHATGANA